MKNNNLRDGFGRVLLCLLAVVATIAVGVFGVKFITTHGQKPATYGHHVNCVVKDRIPEDDTSYRKVVTSCGVFIQNPSHSDLLGFRTYTDAEDQQWANFTNGSRWDIDSKWDNEPPAMLVHVSASAIK